MKRTFSALLAALMLVSCLGTASGAVIEPFRASDYLSSYAAFISAGDNAREINIGYDVSANTLASLVGVYKIVIYKANGTQVSVVNGSVANGLLRMNWNSHGGEYIYKGATSGTSYYAVVTVYASDSSGSDSRSITTDTVKAP